MLNKESLLGNDKTVWLGTPVVSRTKFNRINQLPSPLGNRFTAYGNVEGNDKVVMVEGMWVMNPDDTTALWAGTNSYSDGEDHRNDFYAYFLTSDEDVVDSVRDTRYMKLRVQGEKSGWTPWSAPCKISGMYNQTTEKYCEG